ncbi:hypothetical protein GLOIN_2v1698766, partial [Rhizophagus irregularis DAOM 181602=DAOM 197198]
MINVRSRDMEHILFFYFSRRIKPGSNNFLNTFSFIILLRKKLNNKCLHKQKFSQG